MSGTTVYIVDDDGLMRRSLASLVEAEGHAARTFASGNEFLSYKFPLHPSCLVLDLHMPGLQGTEVQDHLLKLSWHPPVIFVTAHGTVPVTAKAMKAGAVDFLIKPFTPSAVLSAVAQALDLARTSLEKLGTIQIAREMLDRLTPREREVFGHVISGMINKEIATLLGTTERTIKAHRSSVMRKLEANSVVDLVRLAEQAG